MLTEPTNGETIQQGDGNEQLHVFTHLKDSHIIQGSGDDEVNIWRDASLIRSMSGVFPNNVSNNIFDGGGGVDTAKIKLLGNTYEISLQDDGSVIITDSEVGESNTYIGYENFDVYTKDNNWANAYTIESLTRDKFFRDNTRTIADTPIVDGIDIVLARELSALSNFNSKALASRHSIPETEYAERTEITVGSAKALIVNDGEKTIVTFNGTDTITDIAPSMDSRLKETDYGDVHAGYYERLYSRDGNTESLWEQIRDQVQKHGDPVIFTGTSMGGAVAQLAMAEYINEFGSDNVLGLYTFGQPKAGSPSFNAELDAHVGEHYFRVATDDPIAGFPVDERFAHGGQLFSLKLLSEKGRRQDWCLVADEGAQANLDSLAAPYWENRDSFIRQIQEDPGSIIASLTGEHKQMQHHFLYTPALEETFMLSPHFATCGSLEEATDIQPHSIGGVSKGRILE